MYDRERGFYVKEQKSEEKMKIVTFLTHVPNPLPFQTEF